VIFLKNTKIKKETIVKLRKHKKLFFISEIVRECVIKETMKQVISLVEIRSDIMILFKAIRFKFAFK